MKQLMLVSLLGLCGAVAAQTPTQARVQAESAGTRDAARTQADEAKVRAQLEQARKRLDEAAREVAQLSTQLAHDAGGDVLFFGPGPGGPRRAVLGVQIDPDSGKEGARLLGVSPGSAAEDAGLLTGDVIVAIDDRKVAGSESPNREVVEYMRGVEPDQKVRLRVLRAGKNKEVVVVPRAVAFGDRMFNVRIPHVGPAMTSGVPMVREFRGFWPGPFNGLELASITPKLGAYFGASTGVLVVQAGEEGAFRLEDGDVIQSIDGRKPEDGAHALRILRSYKSGEKLTITVLRQRKPVTLAVTMPEMPHGFGGHFGISALPSLPPVPPLPPAEPAGAGTFE